MCSQYIKLEIKKLVLKVTIISHLFRCFLNVNHLKKASEKMGNVCSFYNSVFISSLYIENILQVGFFDIYILYK